MQQPLAHYRDLLAKFLTGALSADDFQTMYFALFLGDGFRSEAEYRVLETLFEAVDEYVDDPGLRSDPREGEQALLAAARDASDALGPPDPSPIGSRGTSRASVELSRQPAGRRRGHAS